MKSAVAFTDDLLEVYLIPDESNNTPTKVFQIVTDDKRYNGIREGSWNLHTNYGRKVFMVPTQLWDVVSENYKEIKSFISQSIKIAAREQGSKCCIIKCSDGDMYYGPLDKEGYNWITFLKEKGTLYVGRHHNKDWERKQEGPEDEVIPVSQQYFDFILNTAAGRIKAIRESIIKLYCPY